jgi:predicted TIM-barrel fold metal-dependent hydrolase
MTLLESSTTDIIETEKLSIIDCDSHLTEPADLWTSRAPKALQDRMPVQRVVDGTSWWFLDGDSFCTIGGNAIGTGRQKVLGTVSVQPFDQVDPSAWSPTERLKLLDEVGIHAQILYPNGLGFSSNAIFAIEDVKQRLAVLQIYNDFLVEVQDESDNRLFPQAVLPIWDMDLTVKEMTRLIDRGITGFTLSDKPELLGLPELPDPYFAPMWDTFSESGTVANFHIGAGMTRDDFRAAIQNVRHLESGGAESDEGGGNRKEIKLQAPVKPAAAPMWSYFGRERKMAVQACQFITSNMRIVTNLCFSNLFDRYPGLKIVSAESGIGWVPYMLEMMDFQFDEMVASSDELAWAKRRPSEYFRDHLYVSFWFEKNGVEKLLEDIGVNNVLAATDIPHPTCFYPGAREHLVQVLSGWSPSVRRRVVQDNAVDLYGIELPDHG